MKAKWWILVLLACSSTAAAQIVVPTRVPIEATPTPFVRPTPPRAPLPPSLPCALLGIGCPQVGALCDQVCVGNVLELYHYEAQGSAQPECPTQPTVVLHCDPYTCDNHGRNCVSHCESDDDCLSGYVCAFAPAAGGPACVPNVYVCDGNHTLVGPTGDEMDCAPYRCQGTACFNGCDSTVDCAEGFLCSSDSICRLPDTGE